jgi:hypothetical protein
VVPTQHSSEGIYENKILLKFWNCQFPCQNFNNEPTGNVPRHAKGLILLGKCIGNFLKGCREIGDH